MNGMITKGVKELIGGVKSPENLASVCLNGHSVVQLRNLIYWSKISPLCYEMTPCSSNYLVLTNCWS